MGKNISIVLISVLLALFLGEFFLRFSGAIKLESPVRLVEDDPILIYRMVPGGEIDKNGFRNEKIFSHYDVIAIGDSQTYGNQASIEDSWPAQLSRLLGMKVYNAAVGGYGPIQYSFVLSKVLYLNPKVVVFGLYLGNDFFDSYSLVYQYDKGDYWHSLRNSNLVDTFQTLDKERPILEDNIFPPTTKRAGESGAKKVLALRNFLRSHLAFYKLLSQRSWSIREKLGIVKSDASLRIDNEKKWAKENSEVAVMYEDKLNGTIFLPTYRLRALDMSDPRIKEGYSLSLLALKSSCNFLSIVGKSCVIAIIPTKEAVYADKIGERKLLNNDYRKLMYNEELARKSVIDFCGKNGLFCVDLLPDLKKALSNGIPSIYPPYSDGHPRKNGYKVIAETIASFLKSHGLIF
jgi:hypothetical protein